MARGWRIEYEGAIDHVLSCGKERRDIFRAGADRRLFLKTRGDCCERFDTDPLRAGLVERLADYPFSSYLYYAYGRNPLPWLSTDLILFGITDSAVSHCVKRVTQKLRVDEGLRVMEGRIDSRQALTVFLCLYLIGPRGFRGQ